MDPDVAELADALDDLAQFLAAHDAPFWADWVEKDAAQLRRGDGDGVTHFLSAFGGMGSLNDLLFHPLNGNAASMDEGVRLQGLFADLSGTAYTLAHSVRHAAQDLSA